MRGKLAARHGAEPTAVAAPAAAARQRGAGMTSSDGAGAHRSQPPMTARGEDVFAAIRRTGDPSAAGPYEGETGQERPRANDDGHGAAHADEPEPALGGHFWVTWADDFTTDPAGAAGPFERMDAAVQAGQYLARQAGQSYYTMAEFDAAGRQTTPPVQWLAQSASTEPVPEPNDDSSEDEPSTAVSSDVDDEDPIAALFSRPALAESEEKPVPGSRWAYRRRKRAERSRKRAR